MSRTFHRGERRVRVRGVRRREPDLRRLARALIEIAQAQAEADAAAGPENKSASVPPLPAKESKPADDAGSKDAA